MPHTLTPSGDRRAVVFDTRPLWAHAVRGILARAGFHTTEIEETWPGALDRVAQLGAELLVADVGPWEGVNGAEWVRRAKRRAPRLHVVGMSMEEDPALIDAVLRGGAEAVVLKSAQPEDLVSTVQQVFHRSVYFADPAPDADPVSSIAHFGVVLTRREREVLELVAEGRANAAIAQVLRVKEQTVKFHLSNTYRKLGVASRTEATRWAHVHGLLRKRAQDGDGHGDGESDGRGRWSARAG